jgi:hypothetical protein
MSSVSLVRPVGGVRPVRRECEPPMWPVEVS